MRFAVEQSLNTVAWQLFQKLTPEVGLKYLLEMNFNRIVASDYYLPSSLGGLTYGVSALEMASAYAALENNGKYREPTCIVKILDSEGNVIVDDEVKEKKIYKTDAANSMVDIMKGVMVRGTAHGHSLSNGMVSAGKTGTTNDKKDGWFCGFTPYYTTAVWVGYDSPKTVNDLYGSTYPLRIWETYMNAVHAKLEPKDFSFEGSDKSDSSSQKKSYGSSSGNKGNSGGGGSIDEDPDDDDPDVDIDEDDEPKATKRPSTTKKPVVTPAPATEAPTDPPADPEPDPDETDPDFGGEEDPDEME